MDLSTRAALVKACLGVVFLLSLLQRRLKMGFKDHLAAMQSHLQKRRRQQRSIPKAGLLSLCSPEGLTSDTFDGCGTNFEKNFYSQKESLTRFASSSSAFQRTSLFPKVSSSKFKFTQNETSVHDPHHVTHLASRSNDAHPSWRDTEGSNLKDIHPEDSGWTLVSRRNSLIEPQQTLLTVRHPRESVVTASDALHPLVSLRESSTTAANAGLAHKLVPSQHRPSSPCETTAVPTIAAAAHALVSLNDSSTPAGTVNMTADACVSLCEAVNPVLSPDEPSGTIENLSAAYSAPQNLATMARTGFAPVIASQLGLFGSNKGGEAFQLKPVYQKLHEAGQQRDIRLKDLNSKIAIQESRLEALRSTRKDVFSRKKKDALDPEDFLTSAAFTPLSKEEEEEVHEALNGANRHQVLVQHEPSNIDLSRAALQCLKPGAWLNDEVINLYMELLKERERREQKGYLKCHFFSTFFFNKLYKDAHSYDFKAVRRWTIQRKLGYSLLECDKIFVPIHKDIHWCLAVINIREKRVEYLDSLKGHDGSALQALARYIKDEARDKGAENVDTSSWHFDCPKDIPEQMNGCDCGMFMIKYADFLSRGNELKFTQEHMEYFRKRTALELLQLKAR